MKSDVSHVSEASISMQKKEINQKKKRKWIYELIITLEGRKDSMHTYTQASPSHTKGTLHESRVNSIASAWTHANTQTRQMLFGEIAQFKCFIVIKTLVLL